MPPSSSADTSDTYRPAWWLSNPHASTMWGKFFRTPPTLESRVERWSTPDDDFVDLVRLHGSDEGATFLLLHGLEGTVRSHYAAGTLREAQRRGWQANLLLFRSCSGEPNRAARSYHSGETSDLHHVVERLRAERPQAPLVLAGVSLGANVLLKWLGEQGEEVTSYVAAAVAVSTPFDLARSCAHIDSGFSRVYAWNFLKTLKAKALDKIRQHPGLADPARVAAADSLWRFDDAYTSVAHGFIDAADYYYRSSSIRYLHTIRVPTLLLSAHDDPFHPPEVLRDVARIASGNPALHVEFTARGGHVGFVEGTHPGRVRYYAERRIAEFGTYRLAASRAGSAGEQGRAGDAGGSGGTVFGALR